MQSTCLTVWDRGIRESGVRVCMCVPESKSKREQEREKGERDFDGEVWTCVSRLTSVAPDRHTQAQRHTYRGLWHIPEADQSSVHALQWAIVLHILKWALGTELSLKTCCAQSQRARTFTHTHTVLQKAGFCAWRLKCAEANRPWHQCPWYFSWKQNFSTFSSFLKVNLENSIWTCVAPRSESLRVKCWILPSSDLRLGISCSFFQSQVFTTFRGFFSVLSFSIDIIESTKELDIFSAAHLFTFYLPAVPSL